MEIIYKEENEKLFGSTKFLGIGKRKPNLIYGIKAKELREKSKLTIEELARKFKMKPFEIERIENQKQPLTEKIFNKYIEEFGINKEYFFDLDLETLILNSEGHVLKSFETSIECKKVFNKIMDNYFEAVKNNKTNIEVNFANIERGN